MLSSLIKDMNRIKQVLTGTHLCRSLNWSVFCDFQRSARRRKKMSVRKNALKTGSKKK